METLKEFNQRSQRKEAWRRIRLIGLAMNSNDCRLLAHIDFRCQGEWGFCFEHSRRVADIIGCCRATIFNTLKRLFDDKLIESSKIRITRFKKTVYFLSGLGKLVLEFISDPVSAFQKIQKTLCVGYSRSFLVKKELGSESNVESKVKSNLNLWGCKNPKELDKMPPPAEVKAYLSQFGLRYA